MTTVTILDWPANPGGWTAPRLDLAVVRHALGADLGATVTDGLDAMGRITLTAAVDHARLVDAARFFLEPHGIGVLSS